MPALRILLTTLLLAVVISGCDPIFNLRGSVTADADQAGTEEAGVEAGGIEGAKLSLFCYRDGEMRQFYPSFTTDAQGHFKYQKIGDLSVDCELRAQKDGYEVVDVPLREACVETKGDDRCIEAAFDIELSPAPEAQIPNH
jgi:hypothetical protein